MKLFSIMFAVLTACVPATSYQGSTAPYGASVPAGTGVYINGEQLTAADKAQFESLLGETVPAGRYALDAQYNFGYEGQPPAINLAAYIRARQATPHEAAATASGDAPTAEGARPFSMYSQDSAGQGSSLVSDGNGCTIMSTPSGSLSSGC